MLVFLTMEGEISVENKEETIALSIYREIESLSIPWSQLVFYGEYGEGSFLMEFYVKQDDSSYIKCFDLPNINENDLDSLLLKINKTIKPIRQELPENLRWSSFTLHLGRDGTFKFNYDYSDVKEDTYRHHTNWKEKYLSN